MLMCLVRFFLISYGAPGGLPSFPTRRSSDLTAAEKAMATVGMTANMNRAIRGYSKGMRQRTKLAQALVHDPHAFGVRSEEHTSELQSRGHIVCRILPEKKKYKHMQKASTLCG